MNSFIDFVRRSPSAFHAVDAICAQLDAAGFVRLDEGEPYAVAPGSRCYVTRNQSSVIAFTVPQQGFRRLPSSPATAIPRPSSSRRAMRRRRSGSTSGSTWSATAA